MFVLYFISSQSQAHQISLSAYRLRHSFKLSYCIRTHNKSTEQANAHSVLYFIHFISCTLKQHHNFLPHAEKHNYCNPSLCPRRILPIYNCPDSSHKDIRGNSKTCSSSVPSPYGRDIRLSYQRMTSLPNNPAVPPVLILYHFSGYGIH